MVKCICSTGTRTNLIKKITLLQVEIRGMTDIIKFDHQGFRTDFTLDIVELGPSGLRKTGTWNSTQGVNFTKTYGEQQLEIVENLKNKTLIVTTILVGQGAEGVLTFPNLC